MNNNATEYKKIYKQYRSILLKAYQYYETLSIDDIRLLMYYKGDDYYIYNDLLGRSQMIYTKDGVPYQQIKRESIRLAEIILNAPKTTEDMIVYRGTDAEFRRRHGSPNEYFTPVITSVSLLNEVSEEFLKGKTCCLYKIHIPAGTPVLPTIYLHGFIDRYNESRRHKESKKKTKKGDSDLPTLTRNVLKDMEIDDEWEVLLSPFTLFRKDGVSLKEIQQSYTANTFRNRIFNQEKNVHNVVRLSKRVTGKQTFTDTIVVYNFTLITTPSEELVRNEIQKIRPTRISMKYDLANRLIQMT